MVQDLLGHPVYTTSLIAVTINNFMLAGMSDTTFNEAIKGKKGALQSLADFQLDWKTWVVGEVAVSIEESISS